MGNIKGDARSLQYSSYILLLRKYSKSGIYWCQISAIHRRTLANRRSSHFWRRRMLHTQNIRLLQRCLLTPQTQFNECSTSALFGGKPYGTQGLRLCNGATVSLLGNIFGTNLFSGLDIDVYPYYAYQI